MPTLVRVSSQRKHPDDPVEPLVIPRPFLARLARKLPVEEGKREGHVNTAQVHALTPSLLRVKAKFGASRTSATVDTGAVLSVLPTSLCLHAGDIEPSGVRLTQASGAPLEVYGETSLKFTIKGFRRAFRWKFVVADVTTPLLGFDFLSHHGMIVDCRAGLLRDPLTSLVVQTTPAEPDCMALQFDTAVPERLRALLPSDLLPLRAAGGVDLPSSHRIETGSSPLPYTTPRRVVGERLDGVIWMFPL